MDSKRFLFPQSQRLKGQKIIETLFQEGKAFFIKPCKIIYLLEKNNGSNLKIAFAIPKKNFKKAVDRNLLKRRFREAFRLNQHELQAQLIDKQLDLNCMVIYNSPIIDNYTTIEIYMQKIFKQFIDKINA